MCLAMWSFAETDGESEVDGSTCFSSSRMLNGATRECASLLLTKWIITVKKSDGATTEITNVACRMMRYENEVLS